MTISAGSDIVAADFIATSAGAGDSGKVPKLNSAGKLDTSFFSFIEFTGDTYSLTTTAGQRVMVWVKGNNAATGGGSPADILLKYNGVTKDTCTVHEASTPRIGFMLQYTEIPGAGTHNITIEGGSVANVKGMILVFG